MTPEDDRTRRWVVLALVAGAAFRLAHYWLDPSLTIDDAMLSYNIASRTWLGLAHPLAFQQTAPLGFLWALRAATLLGGLNEPALRLLPVLAGVALPYAVWRLARKVLSPGGALVAASFAALSPILIQYSISVKPYETDALVAATLALMTLGVIEAPSPRRRAALVVAGAVALLFSTPAVFVLAGCGLALAVRSSKAAWPYVALTGSVWLAVFGLTYVAFTRTEAVSPYMQWFWDHKFLTPAVILADPRRAWDIVQRLPTQVFTGDAPQVVALVLCWIAAVAGIRYLSRKHGASVLVIVGPIGMALLASMFRRYPVAPRLFVFAAPLVAVILAAGVDAAWERWPSRRARVPVGVVVTLWVIVLTVLSVNTSRLWAPPTRPLVAELDRAPAGAGPVYVYAGAVPAWLFYSTDWKDPTDTALAATIVAAERWDGNAFHNAVSRGRAVADTEGGHLAWPRHGHTILLGLSTGIAWREGQWFGREEPDTGWADREAARIHGAADSTAWLMFANVYRREVPFLLHALATRRGRVVRTDGSRGATLYRVRFTR